MGIASSHGSISSSPDRTDLPPDPRPIDHLPSPSERWSEGRAQLKLSDALVRQRRYGEALQALHEAHNFGRDNVRIHTAAHFRYIGFSLRDKDYRRAAGHLYWTITSPILVIRDRKRRAEVALSALK